jgi:hypothetical protein
MTVHPHNQTAVQGPQKPDWKRMLSHTWVARNIPFFLFLALLAVVYIYNGHYADKLMRRMSASEKHLKELEYEYKTVKSDVVFRSKASELARAVAPLGLKELMDPPVMIGGSDNGKVPAQNDGQPGRIK